MSQFIDDCRQLGGGLPPAGEPLIAQRLCSGDTTNTYSTILNVAILLQNVNVAAHNGCTSIMTKISKYLAVLLHNNISIVPFRYNFCHYGVEILRMHGHNPLFEIFCH